LAAPCSVLFELVRADLVSALLCAVSRHETDNPQSPSVTAPFIRSLLSAVVSISKPILPHIPWLLFKGAVERSETEDCPSSAARRISRVCRKLRKYRYRNEPADREDAYYLMGVC
jgi:hypothetical protein